MIYLTYMPCDMPHYMWVSSLYICTVSPSSRWWCRWSQCTLHPSCCPLERKPSPTLGPIARGTRPTAPSQSLSSVSSSLRRLHQCRQCMLHVAYGNNLYHQNNLKDAKLTKKDVKTSRLTEARRLPNNSDVCSLAFFLLFCLLLAQVQTAELLCIQYVSDDWCNIYLSMAVLTNSTLSV